jgi:hypothetical protein
MAKHKQKLRRIRQRILMALVLKAARLLFDLLASIIGF